MIYRTAFSWLSAAFMAVVLAVSGVPEAFAAKTVKLGLFPFGPSRMADQYVVDAGLHKKWGSKVGVDFKVSHPRDDFAAFMGKSVDVVAISTLEVARLVGDEGYDIVMWGRQVDAYIDMYVRSDSAYKTPGDLKGKKLVHPGWSTGTAQMGIVLLKKWFGLDMKKDFKVVTAPWPVGPQLLAKGDVEMSLNLMPLSLELWRTNKIRPVLATYATEWAKQRGTTHHLSISNYTSWGKWLDGNDKAARAWLGAFTDAMKYAHANTKEWCNRYRDYISKNATEAQVDFYVKWFQKYGVLYKDSYIDQTFINEELAFVKLAVEAGFAKPQAVTQKIFRIVKPL